jgi:hypothetical protein
VVGELLANHFRKDRWVLGSAGEVCDGLSRSKDEHLGHCETGQQPESDPKARRIMAGYLTAKLLAGRQACPITWRADTTNHPSNHYSFPVFPIDLAHGVRDFADRGVRFDGGQNSRHQVLPRSGSVFDSA